MLPSSVLVDVAHSTRIAFVCISFGCANKQRSKPSQLANGSLLPNTREEAWGVGTLQRFLYSQGAGKSTGIRIPLNRAGSFSETAVDSSLVGG